LIKKLLIVPPILIGIAILYFMIGSSQPPVRKAADEQARTVRVISADPIPVTPRVTGFGSVYPDTVWNAVAQVSGEVEYVHPDLKKGALLPAGTEIVRISPLDYQLAISQAEANIRATEAKLAELKVTETNTRDLLEIEKRGLELREAELTRKKELFERGTIAQTVYEQEQREILVQRKKVQDLENALRLQPTQRTVQNEQIAVYRAQLESAKLNLARTRIALPFDARIAQVNVEEAQFVQTGSTLVTADSLNVAEAEAQIPISQFLEMVNASSNGEVPHGFTTESLSKIIETIGFEATVRLRMGDNVVEWPARFDRISDTVDPKTRTVGAIVAVDNPYKGAAAGKRPPLSKGMFVEIEIRTRPRENNIVVPRSAFHNDTLYMLTPDNRLEIRTVTTGLVQGDLAIVDHGVEAGEKVVISDLIPAIEGMLLRPQPDTERQNRIRTEAAGGAAQP